MKVPVSYKLYFDLKDLSKNKTNGTAAISATDLFIEFNSTDGLHWDLFAVDYTPDKLVDNLSLDALFVGN